MEQQLQQPALATPPGVVSHFPDTHSSAQVIFPPVACLIITVPGILYVVRVYTKLRLAGGLDAIDVLISLAWPLFITLVIAGWKGVSNGAGAHQWNIRYVDYIQVTYYYYLIEIIYCPCMFFVKTAIVLQFQRLFSPHRSVNPPLWWVTTTYIVAIAIFYCISALIATFYCNPREAAWNILLTNATCLDNDLLVEFNCAFNILSDIAILCLPIRAVWKLQISTRKRIGISALFAIGLLACVCSGMIIYYFALTSGPDDQVDLSYYLGWVSLWGFAEVSFGLVASSAIILPKFFNARAPELKGYWSSFSRPFTSLKAKVFRSSDAGTYEMYSTDRASSLEDRPRLPEIDHVATMTFSSKIGASSQQTKGMVSHFESAAYDP